MKRQSFKYIFYLNLLFIATCAVITFFSSVSPQKHIPVSVTTPIMNHTYEQMPFCEGAASAVIIDGKSGAVLYEKNASVRLPMASTTKIMTALAVIKYADLNATVTVDKKAAGVEGSSIYLREGEKMTVLDLLYGLMLESGNDAATALAIGCFGSEEACCDKMNEISHALGLIDTHFDNVHGLDSDNHYTTAYELARITAEAMKNPIFKQLVSTKNHTTSSESPKYFSNHNRLLRSYNGAVGVKTGYTSLSGRCLVSAAERENELYIAVTLNDRNDWQDHAEMLDFAFDNHTSVEIAASQKPFVYFGLNKYTPSEDIYLTVKGEDVPVIDYKFQFSEQGAVCEYYTLGAKLGFFPLIKQEENTAIAQ